MNAKPRWWHWLRLATKEDIEDMALKLSELKGTVEALRATVQKIWDEQQKRYDDLVVEFNKLKEQLTNVEVPAETETAINDFAAKLKEFDDTIPDTTT